MRIFLLIILISVYGLIVTTAAQSGKIGLIINGDDVKISWLKDSRGVNIYEVERKSAQYDVWREVSTLRAENRARFSFTDYNLPREKFYYRVKSIFEDGISKYSRTVEADLNKPFMFSLNQNYPNPFNPETSIKYSIPEAGYIDLRVFNLLGQEVAALVSEYKEAGEYSVNFNAEELNSGLYIYKLIAGDRVLTRKMTLIK